MPESHTSTDLRAMANAIRALSMDAIQKANSGHPGMPMGMADVATVLYSKFMKFDPARPDWPNRDRFVLSAGHGSMLLYSVLNLTGHEKPTMDDIKNFRQLHSPCAGHPEYHDVPAIEMTTGPLGQGLATSVGMALGERMAAARFGDDVVDHFTYVIAGDGCLMEGISHEAISMAGHLKLGKLIVFWDDNEICIDGSTDMTVSDNQQMRFEAHGWHVIKVDGHDPAAIEAAIAAAQKDDRPSMIACRTIIGFGSPNKQGTSSTHGSPLGDDEIALARKELGWTGAPFEIPADIASAWKVAGQRSNDDVAKWDANLAALDAGKKAAFDLFVSGDLPEGTDEAIQNLKKELAAEPKKIATRKASQVALEAINAVVDNMIGGSADLTGSVNTKTEGMTAINRDDFSGRYMHYGVREFGMGAAMNGLALYGGFIPYGGTFMVFSDYVRPAIRLSALMGKRVIYVMTHDSIGLGEDGPTHQPVEQLASLRAMPNLNVFRPADVVETAECWELAIKDEKRPTIISLTRQGLPQVRTDYVAENMCAKGGYVLAEADDAKVTLVASGSEVEVAYGTKEMLDAAGIPARVVSMPSMAHFDAQDDAYKEQVLGKGTLKVAIEAASTFGWERIVGKGGLIFGMTSFGLSAPIGDLYDHFGLTATKISAAIEKHLD